jgi:hypothetical protein
LPSKTSASIEQNNLILFNYSSLTAACKGGIHFSGKFPAEPVKLSDTQSVVWGTNQMGFAGLIRLQTVASVSSAFLYSNIVLNLNADASAYIDPYIEIDPTWALANPGYSISVSQGVGNTAPVPEAETYAMMLAGLGLVGFMARRRKQLEA